MTEVGKDFIPATYTYHFHRELGTLNPCHNPKGTFHQIARRQYGESYAAILKTRQFSRQNRGQRPDQKR